VSGSRSTVTGPISEADVVLDGVRTRELSVAGEGPPVLLMHGFSDSADTWRPVLATLAVSSRRAVAVDLPGSGRAGKFPRDAVLEPLDRFVAAFVRRHAGETGVVLVGNSLGGLAALRAAQNQDLPIIAVASLAPGGLVARPSLERVSAAGIRLRPLLRVAYRMPVPQFLLRGVAAAFYVRLLGGDPESARQYASHFRSLSDVRRLGATMVVLADEIAAGPLRVEAITAPVLLIWGRRDPLLAVRGARMVTDVVPQSRLVVFDDCGHCPQQQRPADVAALISALPEMPKDN
jgi:pimeloyl-ACP methyl ester carboxylesterase